MCVDLVDSLCWLAAWLSEELPAVLTWAFAGSCEGGEFAICRTGPTILIATRGAGEELGPHPGYTQLELYGDSVRILQVRQSLPLGCVCA